MSYKILTDPNYYEFENNEKLSSDGKTFYFFVFGNSELSYTNIKSAAHKLLNNFHKQNFAKYKADYCISYACKHGILINYELQEDYADEKEFNKFLKEIKSLDQILLLNNEEIKKHSSLYLFQLSPSSNRIFIFKNLKWIQIRIEYGDN